MHFDAVQPSRLQTTYPIPLGWQNAPTVKEARAATHVDSWKKRLDVVCAIVREIGLIKLLGLPLSTIALSPESRFWCDTLKNLLALRTGGQPKAEAK